MPIVYILTNQCMPDTIKIGITNDLEQRIKGLYNTSVPLPFECYYAVQVDDADIIERKIHQGLDRYRIAQNREFFNTSPEEARSLLEMVEVMGGKNVTPTDDIVETPQDKQALDNAKLRRKNFSFQMLDIQPGTVLQCKKDNTITCEVVDDKRVKFRDEVVSLTRATHIALKEMGYDWHFPTARAWCLDGHTIDAIRRDIED